MQLARPRRWPRSTDGRGRRWRRWLAPCLVLAWPALATAQSEVSAGTSVFRESGGPLDMLVIIPEVKADVGVTEGFAINAGWTADVVSGASVAIVDLPAATVDAITSASVEDVRHVLGGGLRVQDGQSSLGAGYAHAFENDYRSHSFDVSARTELYERNTALELNYARAFDEVCDGPAASEPALKARLPDSEGCFGDAEERTDRDLAVHTFQGVWTQNWTPVLNMQARATAQLLDGFQANPYRAVRIGRTAAQEHHPDNRARYALALGVRYFVEPISGTVQPLLRVYRDSWDIRSLSAELAYEQSLGFGLRMRARGRYYLQSGAAFYSDDYVLAPRGQYFTGDRELSPMRSLLLGGTFAWGVPSDEDGDVAGFLRALEITLQLDLSKSWFPEFHYDRVEVPNDTALLGSFGVLLGF